MTTAQQFVFLASLSLLCACTVLPKNVSEKSSLKPGQTYFEAAFLKGAPQAAVKMSGDVAVGFPDDTYWIVRMGRLSHQLGLGNYGLKVDSIASKASKPASYFVSIPKEKEQDLFWLNFLDAMKRSLKESGLVVAPTLTKADALIEFDFAQEGKDEVVSQTQLVPVTSYSLATVKGTGVGAKTYQASSESTSMVPVVSTTTKLKYVRGLTVRAFSKLNRKPLWTVNVGSVGTTGDRRTNFSAVTLGAMRFFERDSGREFDFPVAPNDPYINYLKSGEEDGIYRTPAKQWLGVTLDFCAQDAKTWRGGRFGFSPLGLAIDLGDLQTTSALLSCGHEVDVGHYKNNILMAADSGNVELYDLVLANSKVRSDSVLSSLKERKEKSFALKYEQKFPPAKPTTPPPKA